MSVILQGLTDFSTFNWYGCEGAGHAQHPSVVIAVDDISAAIEKVKRAGGTVFGGPTEIPGVGTYVLFTDTENNRVSMLQPLSGTR